MLQIGGPVTNKPDEGLCPKAEVEFRLHPDQGQRGQPAHRRTQTSATGTFCPSIPTKPSVLSYTFGAKKAELKSDHALWSTVGNAEGPADVGKATDLLARFSQLETTPVLKDSVNDLKPFGLDKPQGKITIESPEFQRRPSYPFDRQSGEQAALCP